MFGDFLDAAVRWVGSTSLSIIDEIVGLFELNL
jgi:hypothetical protein